MDESPGENGVKAKTARERYAEKQQEFMNAQQGTGSPPRPIATSPIRPLALVSTLHTPSPTQPPRVQRMQAPPPTTHNTPPSATAAPSTPNVPANSTTISPPPLAKSPSTTIGPSPIASTPPRSAARPRSKSAMESVEVNSPWSGMESCEGWSQLLGKPELDIEARGSCVLCGQVVSTNQERLREPVRDEHGRFFYRHVECPPPSDSTRSLPRVDLDISSIMPQLIKLGITDQIKATSAINAAVRDLQAVLSPTRSLTPSSAAVAAAAAATPSPFSSPSRFLPRAAFRDLPESEQSKFSSVSEQSFLQSRFATSTNTITSACSPASSSSGMSQHTHNPSTSDLQEDEEQMVFTLEPESGDSRILTELELESNVDLEPTVAAYYQSSARRLTMQRDRGSIDLNEYHEQLKEVSEQMKEAQRRVKAEKARDPEDIRQSATRFSISESKEVREKKEAKAALLIREMETTEETYATSLTKLVHEFVTVLRIQAKEDTAFVTADQLAAIASNLEALERFHAKFYSYLVSRKKDNMSIGEVVLRLGPIASLYTEYVSKWQHQQDALAALRKSSSKFRAFEGTVLNKLSKSGDTARVTLESFFILPVQRVPRYVMFLRELVKNTPEGATSQFELLTQALQRVEIVVDQVNQARGRSDAEVAFERLKHKARFGFPVDFTGKTLLREDFVTLKGGSINHTLGKITELRLFLFTDMLLWTSEAFKFRGQSLVTETSFLLAPEADSDRVWIEVKWPTGVFVFMMKKPSGGVDEKKWSNEANLAKSNRLEKYVALSSAEIHD